MVSDFEIVPAVSHDLKDEVYRIRHKVYCEELAFEPRRPNGREHDEYDVHSLHLLIRNLTSGEFMGCTRLVLARPGEPAHPLPFEKLCASTLNRVLVDPSRLPRDRIAELSRLAVLARFRRGESAGKSRSGVRAGLDTAARSPLPHILAILYLGSISLARSNGINIIFALTDERLMRAMRRLGVKLETISPPIEHRGQRVASMLNANDVMMKNLRPLYRALAMEM